jgi:hypothetical protein
VTLQPSDKFVVDEVNYRSKVLIGELRSNIAIDPTIEMFRWRWLFCAIAKTAEAIPGTARD